MSRAALSIAFILLLVTTSQASEPCYKSINNAKENFTLCLKRAKEGNARAQNLIGLYYKNGRGTNKSNYKAVKWYKKSAAQGFPAGQFNLGAAYYDGKGIGKNYVKALKWLKAAHKQKVVNAGRYLTRLYKDPEAFESIKSKATGSDPELLYTVGTMYVLKRDQKSKYQGYLWFYKAAVKDHIKAQNRLAKIYISGKVIKQDYAKAFQWSLISAKNGDAEGQANVAWHYAHGIGVQKHEQQAREWISKALKQNSSIAEYQMGRFYEEGDVYEKDRATALSWYERSAKRGDRSAKRKIAKLTAEAKAQDEVQTKIVYTKNNYAFTCRIKGYGKEGKFKTFLKLEGKDYELAHDSNINFDIVSLKNVVRDNKFKNSKTIIRILPLVINDTSKFWTEYKHKIHVEYEAIQVSKDREFITHRYYRDRYVYKSPCNTLTDPQFEKIAAVVANVRDQDNAKEIKNEKNAHVLGAKAEKTNYARISKILSKLVQPTGSGTRPGSGRMVEEILTGKGKILLTTRGKGENGIQEKAMTTGSFGYQVWSDGKAHAVANGNSDFFKHVGDGVFLNGKRDSVLTIKGSKVTLQITKREWVYHYMAAVKVVITKPTMKLFKVMTQNELMKERRQLRSRLKFTQGKLSEIYVRSRKSALRADPSGRNTEALYRSHLAGSRARIETGLIRNLQKEISEINKYIK